MSLFKKPIIASGEKPGTGPLELNINVPGTNAKVKVRRSPGGNWTFAYNANKARYNLNNRNKNVPTVRNISAAKLFKQGN